ncbi:MULTISPECIES: MurR/RpiR family transcriptional regulator [unclassified Tatumella]|uniref:MurR/RpiR family transcriptional regulator n=1 Tax=unclassified Tatumella TaxID=2649542 RepID=UPI001BAFEA84|nr:MULTISPECIES: MurR/RpiR family transcriptional regulator [unclassified Tatumella]MBS0856361.1 MurR/RpiR family transcriptional regulator [Tatumella sp. JGM16]MBS0877421.1 MurR/RpiR family transcriptional regulator [Tatumella sp. JGM82]MBS0890706.1 MurR/RpiR family transcriptional regulator [Tatumella sp. JGM94]MBS0893507.1 MurR/RpiR family transcriptional regulator [Tatumella sp. JGM130]MBS0901818.1 MurR/RpiR family transcriptional regulator [Tatumella sp. JGM100]
MDPRKIIVEHYPALTPELQKAAEFILEHNNELVVLSMRAFAGNAGVRPATLLRLAKRLGFNGWGELKDAFIRCMGLADDSYAARASDLQNKQQHPALYDEVFSAFAANLQQTQENNRHSLEQAVSLLDSADQVYICGFRASFPVAWSLYYIYRLFHRQVSLIDGLASNQEIFTREITCRDLVVVVGFAPYSRETLQITEYARAAGATLIAITDSPLSPLAQAATCNLLFPVSSPSFFPSVVSGMGIAECLMAALVARHGDEAIRRIESAERYLFDSGAYIFPGK